MKFSQNLDGHTDLEISHGVPFRGSRRRATRRVTRMSSSLSLVRVSQTSRRRACLEVSNHVSSCGC